MARSNHESGWNAISANGITFWRKRRAFTQSLPPISIGCVSKLSQFSNANEKVDNSKSSACIGNSLTKLKRLGVHSALSCQYLSVYFLALVGPEKNCQLLPPGYLAAQTTDWLPVPLRTRQYFWIVWVALCIGNTQNTCIAFRLEQISHAHWVVWVLDLNYWQWILCKAHCRSMSAALYAEVTTRSPPGASGEMVGANYLWVHVMSE